MRFTLDQHELFRDAERARLARWFGNSDIGPVYFARSGRAMRISADERALWDSRIAKLVDRQVAQSRWTGFEAVAIAVVLIAATNIATALLGDAVPLLRTIPTPVAAAGGFLWPFVQSHLYRSRVDALRHEIEARVGGRMPLDPAIVPLGRRYNVFAGGAAVVALVIVGWTMLAMASGRATGVPIPALMLAPIAWALHFAGRRIDRVQRDRALDPGV